jgi:lipid-binding SYLF domain-containing protein
MSQPCNTPDSRVGFHPIFGNWGIRGMKRSFILLLSLFAVSLPLLAATKQVEKMNEVVAVFSEIQRLPEKSIPPSLMKNAYAVAVIPSVVKVGFVIGGRYGKGALSVRQGNGQWSDPVFISVKGGSVGWQVGAQSTDVVLVFKTRRSVDGILNRKFTLGADASVAAGPVGRKASAATDENLKAEIFSYSRSRGLFAGVALDGAVIEVEQNDNERFYRRYDLTAREIIAGKVKVPPEPAKRFRALLGRYSR